MTTEQTQKFKGELLQSFADELKANGFKIYYSPYDDGRKTTYFYFVEGDNIGYCQEGYFGGLQFSTVHKPCRDINYSNWTGSISRTIGYYKKKQST